jgi:SAM-dependent methyltransferase
MLTAEQRARTLARFQQHREAWDRNPVLRILYADWYRRIREQLPPLSLGPWWELGSGPGFARAFIPELSLSDLVGCPWHDRELSADALPFADGEIGALVLFDVLHHLPSPSRFFAEATRVLRPGGRVVLCEPFISPLSYPVYKFLHEEPLHIGVDPLTMDAGQSLADQDKDPFDSNQAIPTLLFRQVTAQQRFRRRFPALAIRLVQRLAGPSYAASGGFSRGPLLPVLVWRALYALESRLPEFAFAACGFRLLVVIEKEA